MPWFVTSRAVVVVIEDANSIFTVAALDYVSQDWKAADATYLSGPTLRNLCYRYYLHECRAKAIRSSSSCVMRKQTRGLTT